jgi:acetyl-CoA carboxylase biotin carboxylase subunit
MPPLRKVLIANRGEIALRILRSCRDLDIDTVAVYSEADRDALHVRFANEARLIGGPAPAESYLRLDRLMEVARETGADGIHPGYGFLAENSALVAACEDAGIAFIGPPLRAMEVMGDKLASRRAMVETGVPVVPGTTEPVADAESACKIADGIGYPVMLKASAGGGGKGIRAVHQASEMETAFSTASGEAQSAFGDGRMYVEKMVLEPRHIEVQVVGDQHGNIYALGTRECSIQRRHQKLIEEAPAVNLAEGVTERIQEAAVAAARAVGYFSAGTVEFLYSQGEFYFLEMNTRLQVEHPVTEEVFGVDIVELMLRVAGGETLPDLSQLEPRGHAIEVRINAEDPANNFMPSLGTIHGLRMPFGPGARVDGSLYHGMEVTPYYDAMIAKLIASGADRDQARRRMMRMLQEMHIGGVTTSAGFSMQILQTDEFREARADTNFVERYLEEGRDTRRAFDDDLEEMAAVIAALHRLHQGAAPLRREAMGGGLSPWVAFGRGRGLAGRANQ